MEWKPSCPITQANLKAHCKELSLDDKGEKKDLVEKLMVHIFELEPVKAEEAKNLKMEWYYCTDIAVSNSKLCDHCDREGVAYCRECEQHFCQDMANAHRTGKKTKDHKIDQKSMVQY